MSILNLLNGGSSPKPAAQPAHQDLQELLLGLQKFGHPRLHCLSGGWYCVIEMHTTADGAEFTVRSDFSQLSPLAAALQCRERMQAALRLTGSAAS